MKLPNLKLFNKFINKYEKLVFKCSLVEDDIVKLNLISKKAFLILKTRSTLVNKNSHIEDMSFAMIARRYWYRIFLYRKKIPEKNY